ncbi:MAG: methyltransferase domain-containing protein [Eubacterium sp.]|nr:methyltransferase domain-containing protein [Eubacterium sp.]
MELRLKFNEDAANYDKARPSYPDELFADIIAYSGIYENSNILEIGIGTGQATLPFLKLGCNVTAIELGSDLAEYTRSKFSTYKNLKVINADFIEADLKRKHFDLIYCATAFHWLEQEKAYNKIKMLLKPNATLALFWNHPFPNRADDKTNAASKRVYDKYRPTDKPITEFTEKDLEIRKKALVQNGFANVEAKLYKRTRTLTTQEYIALINTYSDHRALHDDIKVSFEKEMISAIDSLGGKINIYDTIDLYLAKKEK